MIRTACLALGSAIALTACSAKSAPLAPLSLAHSSDYTGPDRQELDLLRPSKGGSRIYVQARLPDGQLGLFLLDTGAAVSALSRKTAERLGLGLQENYSYVEGLGGRSAYARGVMPTLALGDIVLDDVVFAVDVRGVPEYAFLMPIDGILGNNIWSRFTLDIDYPADTLTLLRPEPTKAPKRSSPMYFDGHHTFVPIGITTDSDPPYVDHIILQVDTGASELLLSGASGRPFEQSYTEGVEPIYGIGASEFMPASSFLQRTRRIPVAEVDLGGSRVRPHFEAKWMNFDTDRARGPAGMKGLIGHELMAKHRVTFDYHSGWFALRKSKSKPRLLNGHAVLLEQDIERYGDTAPERDMFRAKMLFATGEYEPATAHLESYVAAHPDDAEGRVLLANVRRADADLAGAWDALDTLTPAQLVEQGEIVAAVNGLLLDGHLDDALALADAAMEAEGDESAPFIARADALLALGRLDEANDALLGAAQQQRNPDANLLRRARVALAQGDRHGALAKVRRLLRLYPSGGTFLWFYSTLVLESDEASAFRADMEQAVARLHPGQRPLDFLVAAHHALGDDELASSLMHRGIERDCSRSVDEPSNDNCLAWYYALAGQEPEQALERIERALSAEGDRSDFLDTKAMVHLSRGELPQAHASAMAAARLNPDDVYMLWQAERIGDMMRAAAQ